MNELFPYKVCVNLDRRVDRWRRMQAKFNRHNITAVRRFAAVDGAKQHIPRNWPSTLGAYGCLRSHLKVVVDALERDIPHALIFEDDVVFAENCQEQFSVYKKQLPDDWDMVFFGVLHLEDPIVVSDNVLRIRRAYSTYAYALKDTIYESFIEVNTKSKKPLDVNNFVLQEKFNCYCFTPHLAWVEADYSDAQERVENLWYLRESLVLFGDEANRRLADTTVIFAYRAGSDDPRPTQNLLYLVDYYKEYFSPYMDVIIVEHGNQSSVDPGRLPANCRHILVPDNRPFNRWRCFRAGVAVSDPSKSFFILSDHDIYIEATDIRANLIKCEQYSLATGFSRIFHLTDDDTAHMYENKNTRGINITSYISDHGNNVGDSCCCFVKRAVLNDVLDMMQDREPRETDRFREIFEVFESPNHGLCLHPAAALTW